MKDDKAKGRIEARPTVRITLTTNVKAATAALGDSARRIVSITA